MWKNKKTEEPDFDMTKIYSPESKYPDNTYYIIDTKYNRELLEGNMGKADCIFPNHPDWNTYLVIDLNEKTWRNSPSFEWLYRNQPPLSTIEFVLTKLL